MVAIPLDKINYNKVSKYANVLIFKEFYPKTKNVSYYLKDLNPYQAFDGYRPISIQITVKGLGIGFRSFGILAK